MAKGKKERLFHTLKEPGKARWAHLTEPDEYEGDRKYKIDVVYPELGAYQQKLIKRIDELAKKALVEGKAAAKNPTTKKKLRLSGDKPYGMVLDEDGNETGEVYFRFKMNAEYTKRKTGKTVKQRPALFDAKGHPIDADIQVGNGSIVKVNFEFYPYCIKEAGVSLRMRAVQIINLVEFGSGDAESFGFGEEDGDDLSGYTASERFPEDDGDDGGQDDGVGDDGEDEEDDEDAPDGDEDIDDF